MSDISTWNGFFCSLEHDHLPFLGLSSLHICHHPGQVIELTELNFWLDTINNVSKTAIRLTQILLPVSASEVHRFLHPLWNPGTVGFDAIPARGQIEGVDKLESFRSDSNNHEQSACS